MLGEADFYASVVIVLIIIQPLESMMDWLLPPKKDSFYLWYLNKVQVLKAKEEFIV